MKNADIYKISKGGTAMELWDILDHSGRATGKTVVRGLRRLNPNEYHLVVHIWPYDSNGRLLIQRRSQKRKLMPGEWAATGGSAVSGEESRVAAHRELAEELGIDLPAENLQFARRLKRKNSFLDVWFIKVDVDIDTLKLQREEVSAVRWIGGNQLKYLVKQGRYHNYGREYFELVTNTLKKLTTEEKSL